VVCENEEATYGYLNKRANQLARLLLMQNTASESVIAISTDRCIEMVVGLLAIQKAGAAYLPLDPAYPTSRLKYMLNDAGSKIILTTKSPSSNISDAGALVLRIDLRGRELIMQSEENLPVAVSSDDLIYVIYTSGSTGNPKGVCITHKAVARLVKNTNYAKFEEEIFLHLAPLAFDASTFEIWGSLINGSKLVIMPMHPYSLDELNEQTQRHQAATIFLTTALFHQVVDEKLEALTNARQLLIGGEVLSTSHMNKAVERFGQCQIVHVYGPTENTTFTSRHFITADYEVGRSVPIGKPISNTIVYILSGTGTLATSGVCGEIYAGGDGLARAYLNRPDLTAEKFVPDSISEKPGERIYRTGDWGQYLEDGNVEFLGRTDTQVKLRGYRIELGEIEAALVKSPNVREAVVVVNEDARGDKRLAAYLTANGSGSFNVEAARARLRERLPEYMIPSAFIHLDRLPLTSNGKIDRRALPTLQPRESSPSGGMAAASPVEEILRTIWESLLPEAGFDGDGNFFELGGHSLLATRLVTAVRRSFGVELPLRRVFEKPRLRQQAQIIRRLMSGDQAETRPAIVARGAGRPARLSFAQQRLWFLWRLEPQSGFYNCPAAVRLQGRLQPAALVQALAEEQRRQEALRTRIRMEGQEPLAEARPEAVGVRLVELQRLGPELRQEQVRRLSQQEAERAFEVEGGELLRQSLLRVGEQEAVLLLTMHHIISDGWSIGLLVGESAQLYESYLRGEESRLEELNAQYGDYAEWQREWLSGEELRRQLEYWKSHLEGAPEELNLRADRTRPAVKSYRGASHSFRLSAEVSERLRSLWRDEGVTLFMKLLAGYGVLLGRYSGQREVVIGTPIANREAEEVEGVIGFFANTLALRIEVDERRSYEETVRRTRDVVLGGYMHQDAPFERLVEELGVRRDLSRDPVFQTMLVLQNAPAGELRVPGLNISQIETAGASAVKFDMTYSLLETSDGLAGMIEYNTDLFEAETIRRITRHYETLLERAARAPSQRLSEISFLTEAERLQIIEKWGKNETIEVSNDPFHRLFEQQVDRAPSRVAVNIDGEHISYEQLNARANQLGRYLKRFVSAPGDKVAVSVERGVDMIAAMLATLKAGAVYAPMDPAYPAERLAYMLDDVEAAVLLTEQTLSESLPALRCHKILLDADLEKVAQESADNLPYAGFMEDLSYIIYTSGSTGKPKGAMITHRGLANLAEAQVSKFAVTPQSRVLQFASLSFDASIFEMALALRSGATLCLSKFPLIGQEMVDFLSGQAISVATLPPAVAQALPDADLPALEMMILAGDQCPAELVARWAPGRRLFNAYGPTEASVWTTLAECEADGQKPDIGRPIPNVEVFIIDSYLQPAPVGAPGRLSIGGPSMSSGYVNRAELTAQSFSPNPFSKTPGARLYDTGDLACFKPEGGIEFLGRMDQQVKIRGFRIETGEVEASLMRCPDVQDCVVIPQGHSAAEQQLVAYVVTSPESALSQDTIRRFLRETLPDYMSPAGYIFLPSLPLTLNGKVDRKALSRLNINRGQGADYVEPETDVQRMIVDIWKAVLGVERIGLHDNFFDLGGNSLLLAQAHGRLRSELQADLTIIDLFNYPTVIDLAKFVAQGRDQQTSLDLSGDRTLRREAGVRRQRAQLENRWTARNLE
jgi:amino acid adenylation domain-containing protein